VTLQVGATTDRVEVTGSSQNVTINTTDATVGNNFDVKLVNELPVQVRNSPCSPLWRLQPGVTIDGATTGARVDQNNVTIDGLDVNEFCDRQRVRYCRQCSRRLRPGVPWHGCGQSCE